MVLLLFVRGALVISLGDAFYYGEELEKATAGKAMIDGLDLDHHHLAYHYYEGGGFVISHLKALAFLVFGETLFANKVVAMLSCLAVLAAGIWSCREAFGRAAAHFFAALYVFAPVTVQKLSLISLGIHHEACFFVLVALGLSASLMVEQRPRRAAALGACLGFGVYFSWVVALVATSSAIALSWRWGRRMDPKCLGLTVAGAVLGAAPLLVMGALVGVAVFDIHGTGLASVDERSLSETLRAFFRSIYVDGALGGVVAASAWPLAIIGATILGLRRASSSSGRWRRSLWVYLLFCLVFIAAYLRSAFVQGEVYHFFLMLRLVPLWVVGVCILAGVLGRSWDARRDGGSLAWSGLLLAGLGAYGLAGAVSDGRPGTLSTNWASLHVERGYIYSSYFEKLIPHIPGSKEERLRVLLGFEETERPLLREAIASELFRKEEEGESLEADYAMYQALVESVDPGSFGEYQRGLGPLLSAWLGVDLRANLNALQEAGDDAPVLAEALGRTGRGLRTRRGEPTLDGALGVLHDELVIVEGSPGAASFAAGVGWRLHRVLARTVYMPWLAEGFIESAPGSLQEGLRAGYEQTARAGRTDGSLWK